MLYNSLKFLRKDSKYPSKYWFTATYGEDEFLHFFTFSDLSGFGTHDSFTASELILVYTIAMQSSKQLTDMIKLADKTVKTT